MSHTTSLRRTAAALGATALLGMALAAPAMARQDPGTGGSSIGMTSPEAATKGSGPAPAIVYVEDHAVEYVQVGAGLLTGVAIAGAAAVVASRRRPGGLKPA